MPCKAGFKLHLCRQQLTNLASYALWGLWGNLEWRNKISASTIPLLTTARWPLESEDPSSPAICWSWMQQRNRQQTDDVRRCDSFQRWTKTGTLRLDRNSGPPPPCHGGVNYKESEFLQGAFLNPHSLCGEWEVNVWFGGHLSEV